MQQLFCVRPQLVEQLACIQKVPGSIPGLVIIQFYQVTNSWSLHTANAHCTIISHVVEETCKQLRVLTKKNKKWGTGKIKTWFVTHPAIKSHFDWEEAKHSRKAKERAEKDAQKIVDEAVHTACIHKNTVCWGPATVTTWTVKELLTRIKAYLDEDEELAGQSHFAGLFGHYAPNSFSPATIPLLVHILPCAHPEFLHYQVQMTSLV
ncbi:hypothetical protein SERLA73DRAFT_154373 [Serpula lacrymans var. lacrymans S7.3]|uniref:Uncharacterized protein n=1 Tax=Serpula lacrymans var. lacrymans (strain S7.3) TaxID=936435 RepID=F8Q4G2_SERL3|nr:hypothetical protein SERLA73DRAFT_154373 [Serpula lacrymans var. lacrymans S7.3]